MPINAITFSEALRMGYRNISYIEIILKKNGYVTSVGDEGGFALAYLQMKIH